MSRIGKKPIPVPAGVKVDVKASSVAVQGPKGVALNVAVHPRVRVSLEGENVVVARDGEDRQARALHGLFRQLIANMIVGVTKGFEKKLEIHGVGYGAKIEGKLLSLTVGFSKAIKVPIPEGVVVKLPDATHIQVQGPDKHMVGQFAADVRAVRKPEPYKQTGIRYEGEQVRKKSGKAFGSS